MKKYLEGKYSLAVNFWGFMIVGGFIFRFVCGYFSYFYGSTLIYLGAAYTFITSYACLLYTSPSPRDGLLSRMPSSA